MDAVDDAVSAFTDLVHSIKKAAKSAGKSAKTEAKARVGDLGNAARKVAARLNLDAKQAEAEVLRRGRGLKDRFERAWDVLIHGDGHATSRRTKP
jgi:hypothetical protein